MPTHFDIAPGIALDCNDEKHPGLKVFVTKTIRTLAGIKLGKELLAEFNPAHEKWKVWAGIKVPTTLLISPPNPKQAATLQALETKPGKLREGAGGGGEGGKGKGRVQKIICWWPGSENTELRMGVKVALKAAVEKGGFEKMMASSQLKQLEHASFLPSESGEFQYYGETQTFRIALIHEMIHAFYGLKGEKTGSDSEEEKKVVGIYQFRGRKYTENKFRFLLDLPLRDDYKRLGIESDIELWPECETWCNFRSDWQ